MNVRRVRAKQKWDLETVYEWSGQALTSTYLGASHACTLTLRRSQSARGNVLYAHSWIHGLPWSVPDSVANRHVLPTLKTQFFRLWKGSVRALHQIMTRLEISARKALGQAVALAQTSTLLWAHGAERTEHKYGYAIDWW